MMNKILLFILLWLPFFVSGQEVVMVVSDPHVLASSLVEEGEAFDSMMAGQRKMLDVSEKTFVALVDTALRYKPSLVLIPGDMTKDGEVASHEVVVNQLNRLCAAGIKVLVVPGNHDINGAAFAYRGGDKVSVESLQENAWERTYSMVYDEVRAKDPNSLSYVSEPLSGVTVLGIDCADGVLSDESLSWLLVQADEARQKGNMIIAMSHWQLLEHVDGGDLLIESSRMQDADKVRDALMAHGVRMVLTGHVHINSISTYRDTTSVVGDSIVEISTGSPITYPCSYRWLTVSQDRSCVSVETDYLRYLIGEEDWVEYSRSWMKAHLANMIPGLSLRLFDKSVGVIEGIVADKLAGNPMASMIVMMVKQSLPQTDEDKVALVEKHLGSTLVELYLLHSLGNEPDRSETDSLAQAMYHGMEMMIREMTEATLKSYKELQDYLVLALQDANKSLIQSLVEDRTHWGTKYSNRTDDLQGSFVIQAPQTTSVVDLMMNNEWNGAIYDIQGRRVSEMQQGVYIQNGKKLLIK